MLVNNLQICYAEIDETLDPCISTLYVYFNYDFADPDHNRPPAFVYTKADYIYLDSFKGPTVIYLN